MPKILDRRTVLGGRGMVVTYESEQVGKFFYREPIPGTKRYRSKLIKGASTLEQAEELAMDAAIALGQDDPHHLSSLYDPEKVKGNDPIDLIEREERLLRKKERLAKQGIGEGRPKPISIERAIRNFNNSQLERVQAGTFSKNSYEHKKNCLRHCFGYLTHVGVTTTNQINTKTFDRYLEYRSDTTRIVWARELSVIGEWIKSYLVENSYVEAAVWMNGNFLPKPKVRQTDRMANPAINAEDWETIIHYVRDIWRKEKKGEPAYPANAYTKNHQPQRKTEWYRNMFWHWILLCKNTGMSPEEVCKLKWKNVEIVDVGRISRSKLQEEAQEYEAAGIEVQDLDKALENLKPGDWASTPNHMGREERLIAYITTIRAKTQQPREIPANVGKPLKRWMQYQRDHMALEPKLWRNRQITPDSYVFANPYNEFAMPHQQRIGDTWRNQIIKPLKKAGKLKGHKFSDKPYTLYSMRSTFIEDHLIKGTDIFLVARIAGHDVKTLQETYERMDIRKRAKEITDIQFGQTKAQPEVVNLFDDTGKKK